MTGREYDAHAPPTCPCTECQLRRAVERLTEERDEAKADVRRVRDAILGGEHERRDVDTAQLAAGLRARLTKSEAERDEARAEVKRIWATHLNNIGNGGACQMCYGGPVACLTLEQERDEARAEVSRLRAIETAAKAWLPKVAGARMRSVLRAVLAGKGPGGEEE